MQLGRPAPGSAAEMARQAAAARPGVPGSGGRRLWPPTGLPGRCHPPAPETRRAVSERLASPGAHVSRFACPPFQSVRALRLGLDFLRS